MSVRCRARYLSITDAPKTTESLRVNGEETFVFSSLNARVIGMSPDFRQAALILNQDIQPSCDCEGKTQQSGTVNQCWFNVGPTS